MSVIEKGNLSLDISNAENGNFMAKIIKPSAKRQKIRIIKDANVLTFDLNKDGSYETFPLENGSGNYCVRLYENHTANKYVFKGDIIFNVKEMRQNAFQLVPNQYVNYTYNSEFIQFANNLCFGYSEEESYQRIVNYISSNYRFDYVRALTVKAGTLPDIQRTYQKKMGICQDLAALTVAMLRSQGIPSKLVIGWADKDYHAWVTATVGEKDCFYDPTLAVTYKKRINNYTVERWY